MPSSPTVEKSDTTRKGDITRARILRAAVELLSRHGPDGFTASALATEAGVSKATVFHHFSTLDDVPVAAFEEVILEGMTRVEGDHTPLGEYLHALSGEMHPIMENERFVAAVYAFQQGFGNMFDVWYRTFDAPPYFPEGTSPSDSLNIVAAVAVMLDRFEIKDTGLKEKYPQFFRQPPER